MAQEKLKWNEVTNLTEEDNVRLGAPEENCPPSVIRGVPLNSKEGLFVISFRFGLRIAYANPVHTGYELA